MEMETAVAHIVTRGACTGPDVERDPEILVMTLDCQPMGYAELIERHPWLGGVDEAVHGLLRDLGWQATEEPARIRAGYYIVTVEREV